VDELDALERATDALARLVAGARPAVQPKPTPVAPYVLPELAAADALLPEYLRARAHVGLPTEAATAAEVDAVRQAAEERSAATREHAARVAAAYPLGATHVGSNR
jgi:hypothetical protein